MPPTLKMATATLHTLVQTPGLIGSLYRSIQVSLKKDRSFWWWNKKKERNLRQTPETTELISSVY